MFLMSADPFSIFYELKLIWFLVAGAVVWGTRYLIRLRAHNWQFVFGKIEGYLPLREDPGEQPLAIGYLQYSYSVGSDYYSGEMLLSRLQTRLDLDGLKAALPSGTTIEVRYDPAHPDTSLASLPRIQPPANQIETKG